MSIIGLPWRWNRLEAAGSLGDLGTLLPLAIGIVFVNGLDPGAVFLPVGLFYIGSGLFFGTTVPVQPMKVIGAYAIATGMSAGEVYAAGLLMGGALLLFGASGAAGFIGRCTPKAVIRGVQLTTGLLLMTQGLRFILGESSFQALQGAAEPFLALQEIAGVPVGLPLGILGVLVTLLLVDNRRFPAGLAVVSGGVLAALLLGPDVAFHALDPGFHLPRILPAGWPSPEEFRNAFFLAVVPQLPLTLLNADIAFVDLSSSYFGRQAGRITYRTAALSMSAANLCSALLGGMPMCHGAGGLAAHYRFGARTAASNLMIGGFFLVLTLFLGGSILELLKLLPMAVLGVLLLFAGGQLGMRAIDLEGREEFFVALLIVAVTLAANLAVGFVAGFALSCALRLERFHV
ncbi:MAG: hypothetical protein K9L28_04580 [Synergistales bacterium]|nr:hypothetical protein [Synergistales bacterium]